MNFFAKFSLILFERGFAGFPLTVESVGCKKKPLILQSRWYKHQERPDICWLENVTLNHLLGDK